MPAAKKYGQFISGRWVKSEAKDHFPTRNPAKPSQILAYFPNGTAGDVKRAIDAAEIAQRKWAATPAPKRGLVLLKIAELLKQKKEELARLETAEMGKVLAEARADVQEAIDVFEYMAGEGRRLYGYTTPSELKSKFCATIRRPIGVVGIITPWNFPVAIPAWKLAPALICGNAVVFKPSSDTPLCAAALVELMDAAGVPPGVVNFVTGAGEEVGGAIIRDERVRAVSFTGHRDTGRWILANAGLKRVGLEMGGKNPLIVMDDADLKLAVDGIVWAGFGTSGQRCTAASRVIVHRSVMKEVEEALVKRVKALKVGDGARAGTDLGPLVNQASLEKTERYVKLGIEEGAKLLCGGKRAKGEGYFYEPTLFTDVETDMRIAQEEIFGPVVSLIEAKDLDDAIEKANDTEYGLSSSIYTRDVNKAMTAVERIEAGITYVNASTIGAEVHMPFGGIKHSGNGAREAGILGIEEFSETKAVYIDYSGKLQRAQID